MLAVSCIAWLGRWIEWKLPIRGKKLFNHGVVWCTETLHHESDQLKPALPITDDNVQATELDGAALSHLRSTAGDFTKVFGVECLLQRVLEPITALERLNVTGNADIEEVVAALLRVFGESKEHILPAVLLFG